MKNKAGYTATSCGRVGRGGNARFHTFELDYYRRADGWTDQRTDGQSLLQSCVFATKKKRKERGHGREKVKGKKGIKEKHKNLGKEKEQGEAVKGKMEEEYKGGE